MHAHPAATSTNSHPRTHKTLFMTLHRPPSPPRPPLARPQTCAQSGPGARPLTRWRNRRPSTAGGRWGHVLVMDQKGRGWKRKMVVRGSAASLILRGGPPSPASRALRHRLASRAGHAAMAHPHTHRARDGSHNSPQPASRAPRPPPRPAQPSAGGPTRHCAGRASSCGGLGGGRGEAWM